jgi:hypothetical protein
LGGSIQVLDPVEDEDEGAHARFRLFGLCGLGGMTFLVLFFDGFVTAGYLIKILRVEIGGRGVQDVYIGFMKWV